MLRPCCDDCHEERAYRRVRYLLKSLVIQESVSETRWSFFAHVLQILHGRPSSIHVRAAIATEGMVCALRASSRHGQTLPGAKNTHSVSFRKPSDTARRRVFKHSVGPSAGSHMRKLHLRRPNSPSAGLMNRATRRTRWKVSPYAAIPKDLRSAT